MPQGSNKLVLSPLGKTWLLDIDGTIVLSIPETDRIIFLTSREPRYIPETERFLRDAGVRWDEMISGLPYGERIVVNDMKPSGLKVSVAVDLVRDAPLDLEYEIDESL